MFNPKDLTISLRAVTKPQHILNGGPEGATFPGWFLTAQENEGYVVIAGPVQLTPDEVTVITDVIDRTIDHSSASHWRVTNAVKRCTNQMRDDLKKQLEMAETQAARIPDLKRRLGIDG